MSAADKAPRAGPAKPPWLTRRVAAGQSCQEVEALLRASRLHTVCEQARCPNVGECFARRTATFLILGTHCTRNCAFCAVAHGPTAPPDPQEPLHVARTAGRLGLRFVVVTSVTRDDLPDGGAAHFARTIREIRREIDGAHVEVLVPDFQGSTDAVGTVVLARPDVFNHNVETVPRLYSTVRPQADYHRSLRVLEQAARTDPTLPTKSGIMVGLGESPGEVEAVFSDLLQVGCSMLTIGQYLQPSRSHLPVHRYIPPDEFAALREQALRMGFVRVASGPFVRSSYHAEELFDAAQ
jgi:lipoic acid synthetase